MKNKIYIITGLNKTGKTTRLMNWVVKQNNIDGILQPVVDGKRLLYHISTRTLKLLESENEIDSIKIGKYNFSKYAFNWANEKLIESLQKNFEWIVVDEIGPLELRGEGLHKSILFLLNNSDKQKLIFVIREKILDEALKHYNICEYEIINNEIVINQA